MAYSMTRLGSDRNSLATQMFRMRDQLAKQFAICEIA